MLEHIINSIVHHHLAHAFYILAILLLMYEVQPVEYLRLSEGDELISFMILAHSCLLMLIRPAVVVSNDDYMLKLIILIYRIMERLVDIWLELKKVSFVVWVCELILSSNSHHFLSTWYWMFEASFGLQNAFILTHFDLGYNWFWFGEKYLKD